ncbi:MAG: hypothetical protein ABR600_04325 [Actinomycetota bacterium]
MRRALAIAAVATLALGAGSRPAAAVERPPRQVFLILVDGTTFESFMRVPEFRALARAGGAGLMSFRTVHGDRGPGAELTLGTGVRSAVPVSRVPVILSGDRVRVGGLGRIVEANEDRSTPGLLGSILEHRGLTACADASQGTLATMDRRGTARPGPVPAGTRPGCDVSVVSLPAGAGQSAGALMRGVVEADAVPGARLLLVVLQAGPSPGMLERRDQLSPIAVASGSISGLFDRRRPMHSLTSDTTRRDGVVSNEDVAPTILSFLHIPVPSEMNGEPIRRVDAGPPFDLHRRHLEQRRLTVPIQVGLGLAELIVGLILLFLVGRRQRIRGKLARHAGALPLTMAVLGVSALAAGGLPRISYAWVVPFLLVVPLAAGLGAIRLRRRGALVPAAAIGAAILAFFAVEAVEGWPDTLTTLFGGTALDGARFYGMPNIEVGLVLGAALWLAAILPTYEGFVCLLAAGLFAGFPDLGVNFGAAITIFAAAGMWLAVRTRMGWLKGIALVVGVTAAGLGAVVGANLLWSEAPTHGARFVHDAPGRGWSGLWTFASNRLLVGWRLLVHAPLSWVPVLGLLPALWFVLRPTPTLRASFDRYPAWRDAVLVTILASMVAYVANDSGAAAVGWGFGLAVAGIFYLPLVEETWKHR